MREYSKVSPQFWSGKTGKAIKAQGPECVIVSLYLLTCQHANMLGIYYLSPHYIAVDTGLPFEGAMKGLQRACEACFCRFDEASEVVCVMEMAMYQVGEQLDPKDNRCKGIQREYDALPENPFLTTFYERYAQAFSMTSCRGKPKGLARASKAPPKPGAGEGAGKREEGAAGPRGSRLPTDWAPKDEDLQASGLRNGRVASELEKFRDYWASQPGQKGVKADWNATWRNWCRKAAEYAPPSKVNEDKFAGAL